MKPSRINLVGRVAVSLVIIFVVLVLLIVWDSVRSDVRAVRESQVILERLRQYVVIAEDVAGGERTDYDETVSTGYMFSTFVYVDISATYEFDHAIEGVERYFRLAKAEGWEITYFHESVDEDRGFMHAYQVQGNFDLRGTTGGENDTSTGCWDTLVIRLEYSDPEGPVVMSVEVSGSPC